MSNIFTCPQCQKIVPADSPGGLCLDCFVRVIPQSGEAPGSNSDTIDFPDITDQKQVAEKLPQFELLQKLGSGYTGAVYKARDPELNRFVALKILPPLDALSPDSVERFNREAQVLAGFNHPHIVKVYHFHKSAGLMCIVMEYVDGASLRQAIQLGKLSAKETLTIIATICEALDQVHSRDVVHRDIKPENLLINSAGKVIVVDFGFATYPRPTAGDPRITQTGMQIGTLRYMSPEQMENSKVVDRRSDLFSLGVVMYEMLTGELPMGVFEPPSKKVQVPDGIDDVVMRLLQKEPDYRYQSANDLRRELEKILKSFGNSPPGAQVVPASPFSTVKKKVYISYCHTLPDSRNHVRPFAEWLAENQFDVIVDYRHRDYNSTWAGWISGQIIKSDWVIVFFDAEYNRIWRDGCAPGTPGYGTHFEATIIKKFLESYPETRGKIRFLVLNDRDRHLVPNEYPALPSYVFYNDNSKSSLLHALNVLPSDCLPGTISRPPDAKWIIPASSPDDTEVDAYAEAILRSVANFRQKSRSDAERKTVQQIMNIMGALTERFGATSSWLFLKKEVSNSNHWIEFGNVISLAYSHNTGRKALSARRA